MTVPHRSSHRTPSPFPCYLCGEGTDSIEHLYGGACEVVNQALKRFSLATEVDVTSTPTTSSLTLALLAFPPTSNPTATLLITSFNWAVWFQRTTYFSTLAHTPPLPTSINRIFEFAFDRRTIIRPKSISTTSHIADIITTPPPDAITIYTDGSSIPNPGPSGAGLWVTIPTSPSSPSFLIEIAISLGYGDNNAGEIHAIDVAIDLIKWLTTNLHFPQPPPSIIISDSMGCIGYILHRWTFASDITTARHARRSFHASQPETQTKLYWARGHANIPGNMQADRIAKYGARHHDNIHTTRTRTFFHRFLTPTHNALTPTDNNNPNLASTNALLHTWGSSPLIDLPP